MVEKKVNARILPLLKKLEYASPRTQSTSLQSGTYRSFSKGKGMEFVGYRHYSLMDDASLIDWKASLRTQELLIKEFVEERNLNVFILIDVSSKMVFGSTPQLKCEIAAEIAAAFAYRVLEAEDALGFALFSDKPVAKIRPSRGATQMFLFSKALLNPNNYGGHFSLSAASRFLMRYVPPRSMVIIISDFLAAESSWDRYLGLIARRFETIGIMVLDPRDIELPSTGMQVVVSQPGSGQQLVVDTAGAGDSYRRAAKSVTDDVCDVFKKRGADLLTIVTNEPFEKPLRNFFSARAARR